MRYTNHLILAAPKVAKRLTSLNPFLLSEVSKVNLKVDEKLLSKGTIYTKVWDKEHLRLLNGDKFTQKLSVTSKIPRINLYKESLKRIIKDLERFPENKEVIAKLKETLGHLKPLEPRHVVILKGKVAGDKYREVFEKLDTDTPIFTRVKQAMDKVNETRGEDFKKEQETVIKKRLGKTYNNTLLDRVDINFLKTEFIFTKLKYSRCPQYDSVSGGFAALLAGFIGFLISEKFGIELVDSGDFYIALMYGIFVGFSVHLLLRITSHENTPSLPTSFYHNSLFYKELLFFLFNKLYRLFF